jgi:hypothetical protein
MRAQNARGGTMAAAAAEGVEIRDIAVIID